MREARWHFTRCSVSAGSGSWSDAFHSATAAHRVASAAGASVLAELALNNLAVAQVAVGRLLEARQSVAKLLASQRRSGQALLTRSSIDLSLALAEGDLGRAAEIDETASRLADEFQGGHNSYGYWYRIARVPFLVRTGRADVATRLAEEAISQLNGSPDRALLDRVRAAGALAFAALGNPRKSVGLVEDVALGPLGRIPELVASVEAALGNIAGLSDVHAHEHLNRAARIYAHVGHETGRAAALRDSERRSVRTAGPAILRGAESRSIRSRSTGTSCRRWHRWRVVARCGCVG